MPYHTDKITELDVQDFKGILKSRKESIVKIFPINLY